MTNACTTQDYFILPAPLVGGLPISQDWLDRMNLVRNHTIPVTLPSGKNILVGTMYKNHYRVHPTIESFRSVCLQTNEQTYNKRLAVGGVPGMWLEDTREREMFYLTTHSTHFIYGYMASDIWLRTILIVRKETRCRHIGYSYRLTARVLLYAPSHRQDNTYHGLCYTSRGALAGTRNSSMGPPHEGSIRRPTAP